MNNIPFFDPKPQLDLFGEDAMKAVRSVIESGSFIGGSEVSLFEGAFAGASGAPYATSVNSGTDAITLALKTLGLKEKDQVITTPFTFIATAEAIVNAGARPLFSDIDESFNLDPKALEKTIKKNKNIKAIVFVYLFGKTENAWAVKEIAEKHNIPLIEDCAQAFGSKVWDGLRFRPVGTLGMAGCFSFYPTKTLGGIGDGGMVISRDADVISKIMALKNHGTGPQTLKYHHTTVGANSRLDAIQAAFLRVKLANFNTIHSALQKQAEVYAKGFELPWPEGYYANQSNNLFTVINGRRDLLATYLSDRGIGSSIFYPVPCHQQEAFKKFKSKSMPYAESIANHVISLPIYYGLDELRQAEVISAVNSFKNDEQ